MKNSPLTFSMDSARKIPGPSFKTIKEAPPLVHSSGRHATNDRVSRNAYRRGESQCSPIFLQELFSSGVPPLPPDAVCGTIREDLLIPIMMREE
tara:strand:- start:275 stop:556 length:282 start_codon:yes stop_codon:yes gene_type:complete